MNNNSLTSKILHLHDLNDIYNKKKNIDIFLKNTFLYNILEMVSVKDHLFDFGILRIILNVDYIDIKILNLCNVEN